MFSLFKGTGGLHWWSAVGLTEGYDRLSSGFPALSAEKFDLFDRLRGIGKILMMGLGGFDPQL